MLSVQSNKYQHYINRAEQREFTDGPDIDHLIAIDKKVHRDDYRAFIKTT